MPLGQKSGGLQAFSGSVVDRWKELTKLFYFKADHLLLLSQHSYQLSSLSCVWSIFSVILFGKFITPNLSLTGVDVICLGPHSYA